MDEAVAKLLELKGLYKELTGEDISGGGKRKGKDKKDKKDKKNESEGGGGKKKQAKQQQAAPPPQGEVNEDESASKTLSVVM